ncbi:MAG: glucan 1,4-alpha-glucosidase [Acetobacteraceae bacterium]|nr:glucan 1,4-alpha-glucosidase [Acetobacteraceae bacterium]
MTNAPGWPGIPPRWTSSAKTGVGTALSPVSRVWFTTSHGILNEVYYPRVDQACTRDFGLLITGENHFFAEEKRDCDSVLQALEDGVPAYRITNTERTGRFKIVKQVFTDPRRDVVMQQIRLEVPSGEKLRLFALLAAHLVNGGAHNTAWVDTYKGMAMLFAEGAGTRLALGAWPPFLACSVGFVGSSDGWQQLSQHGSLTDLYDRAQDGNVALTAELDVGQGGPVMLALGFGRTATEAAYRVRASLQNPVGTALEGYAAGWRGWQASLRSLDHRANGHNFYRVSTAVLRAHESPTFPGGLIASLSVPWGASKGDDDLGGYHLVWPRDLVQTAGGFLACGAHTEARRVLRYLRTIQERDGSWPQNCWLDGTPYWHGLQLDECAFPILLVDMALRDGALGRPQVPEFWPMVRQAASFVVRNGPATPQDRWEEDAGYTPFTIAVEIAALLAAADLADLSEAEGIGAFLRDTADDWNNRIEDWLYATDTPLAHRWGVAGHYLRIVPMLPDDSAADQNAIVQVRNRLPGEDRLPAKELVSVDALALVRFGLRAADDPRIVDTVKVIDELLKADLPQGPCWHRYNQDGYGEKPDGAPYDGTGIGRPWPLLTGERAHYELAAGSRAMAERLLGAFEAHGSPGAMLPEQVWDGPPIPERELFPGQPSGSAMPLVWAHAEYIKLLRSLADGAVFDMPPQTLRRYVQQKRQPRCRSWRPNWRSNELPAGRALRIELPEAATIRWSTDAWSTSADVSTQDPGLGIHMAELPTQALEPGQRLTFTWRTTAGGAWAGKDFVVTVR